MPQDYKNRVQRRLQKIENPESREAIDTYTIEKRANGRKWSSINSTTNTLLKLANFIPEKSVTDYDKEDLVRFIAHLSDGYAFSTVTKMKVHTKNFYLHHKGDPDLKEYPDCIKWLQTTGSTNGNRKDPDVLLNRNDVKKMIKKCDHPRDKAIIAVLYESGARLSEFLGLKLRSIDFDKYGAIMRLNPDADNKTGTRRIRLVESEPYLRDWIQHHPDQDDKNAPLFISLASRSYGTQLSNSGCRGLLNKIADRTDIGKNVYPHLFRHSRATELAKEGYTERDMEIMLGWVPGSDMPATYVHMSGADIEEKILRFHGLLDEDEKSNPLEPWECPRCDFTNGSDIMFCGKCALAKDQKSAEKLDKAQSNAAKDINTLLEENPELQNIMNNMLQNALAEMTTET